MIWIWILELVVIFLSRIIEVSIGTLRIILVNKGFRKQASVLAFIEALLWVFVASRVISVLAEEPVKGIVYGLGFATGVYVGSKLENKIAMGKVLIQIILSHENGLVLSKALRESGYGVTTVAAEGKDAQKSVLIVYAHRKGKDSIANMVYKTDPNALVVIQDITSIRGGYISPMRNLTK